MGHLEVLIGFIAGGLLWLFVFFGVLVKKNKKENPISNYSVVELSNENSEVNDEQFIYIPTTEENREETAPTEKPEKPEERPDGGHLGEIATDIDTSFAGDSVKDEPIYKVDDAVTMPDEKTDELAPEPEKPIISTERANSWQWVSNRYRIIIDNVTSGDRDAIVNICKQLGLHYTII